jgi:type III secretion protein V
MPETRVLPVIPVSVTLSAVLDRMVAGGAGADGLRDALTQGLEGLLQTLGLPGRPEMQIAAPESSSVFPVNVTVNGRKCRYSLELLQRVQSYVTGEPIGPAFAVEDVENWLTAPANRHYLAGFVTLTCVEACKVRASVLLSPALAAAYAAGLPGFPQADGQWLAAVLGKVLDLRLPLADLTTVAGMLGQAVAQARAANDAAEDLIAALASGVVEIRLPEEYLRDITTADTSAEYEHFASLRDELFYEFGLRCPEFRFVTAKDLRPGSVVFTINHMTMLPWAGLRPGELLVSATPERLRLLSIEGRAAVAPAGGASGSIAGANDRAALEAAGLVVWDALGYVLLCLSGTLQNRMAGFIHRNSVEKMLEQLAQAFPALVSAARGRYSVEQITRVLRDLATDRISVRNLRLILENLLDYDQVPADPSTYIVFDDRLPARTSGAANLTSFVRSGMKSYLSHKYAPARNLPVYLLDSNIEKRISGREDAPALEDESLLAAMRRVIQLPNDSTLPVLVTTAELRPAVRDIIYPEFAWLSVVAYEDLALDLNVQPLGRITLAP